MHPTRLVDGGQRHPTGQPIAHLEQVRLNPRRASRGWTHHLCRVACRRARPSSGRHGRGLLRLEQQRLPHVGCGPGRIGIEHDGGAVDFDLDLETGVVGALFLERRLHRARMPCRRSRSAREQPAPAHTALLCSHASRLAKGTSFLPASAVSSATRASQSLQQESSGVIDGGDGAPQRTRLAACNPMVGRAAATPSAARYGSRQLDGCGGCAPQRTHDPPRHLQPAAGQQRHRRQRLAAARRRRRRAPAHRLAACSPQQGSSGNAASGSRQLDGGGGAPQRTRLESCRKLPKAAESCRKLPANLSKLT